MEFTGGEFLHLALVPNPRYERANIVMNSQDDAETIFLNGLKTIIENALDTELSEEDKTVLNGLYEVFNDKWITIKPNGEENKGRHLLVKDGETPREAVERTYGKSEEETIDGLGKVEDTYTLKTGEKQYKINGQWYAERVVDEAKKIAKYKKYDVATIRKKIQDNKTDDLKDIYEKYTSQDKAEYFPNLFTRAAVGGNVPKDLWLEHNLKEAISKSKASNSEGENSLGELKAKNYNPEQPRVPAGNPNSGQFAKEGTNDEKSSLTDLLGEEFKDVKGQDAINKVYKEQRGYVKNAFYRDIIGEIAVFWGNSKCGLKHIVEHRKDRNIDAKEFLKGLGKVIERGSIDTTYKDKDRWILKYKGKKAIISKELRNEKFICVLTAFL